MNRLMPCLFVLSFLFTSCRTITETKKEKEYAYKTDTLYKSLLVQDSIYIKDSIVLREKGDTVFSEKWHVKYIDRLRTDTLYRIKSDSVYVDVYVEKEKHMTRLERAKMFLTDSLYVIAFLAVVAAVWYIYRKVFAGKT